MRVDVMQTGDGNMIVNEFESLEALYMSAVSNQTDRTVTFLREYWAECVLNAIEENK